MNIFAPIIRRPTGISLLAIGLTIAGLCAYFMLGVAALPTVELPGVFVVASEPGASPQQLSLVSYCHQRPLIPQAGVDDDQQLAHNRHDGHLGWFPSLP